jgi:hypothetical protein
VILENNKVDLKCAGIRGGCIQVRSRISRLGGCLMIHVFVALCSFRIALAITGVVLSIFGGRRALRLCVPCVGESRKKDEFVCVKEKGSESIERDTECAADGQRGPRVGRVCMSKERRGRRGKRDPRGSHERVPAGNAGLHMTAAIQCRCVEAPQPRCLWRN